MKRLYRRQHVTKNIRNVFYILYNLYVTLYFMYGYCTDGLLLIYKDLLQYTFYMIVLINILSRI